LIRFNLHEFQIDLSQKGIMFCFSGPISQDVIEGIGGTLRHTMELEDADLNITQKVFSIFVEQMQNVVSYSADRVVREDLQDGDIRIGVIIIGQENDHFYVLCGNRIERQNVESLRSQLQMLRDLNKEDLKKLYRDRRKSPPHGQSKGAGLGFIDMARKATYPIQFDFSPVDEDFDFFTIKAVI
jgi:hypothetical protein